MSHLPRGSPERQAKLHSQQMAHRDEEGTRGPRKVTGDANCGIIGRWRQWQRTGDTVSNRGFPEQDASRTIVTVATLCLLDGRFYEW